jgi:hypothetical protein
MARRLTARKNPRMRRWRIIRALSLTVVFWFAALGVCLFAYDHYFKFLGYPYFLGGPIRPHE